MSAARVIGVNSVLCVARVQSNADIITPAVMCNAGQHETERCRALRPTTENCEEAEAVSNWSLDSDPGLGLAGGWPRNTASCEHIASSGLETRCINLRGIDN